MVPQAGMSGVTTIAPIIVGDVLANAGIPFDASKLVDSLPSGYSISQSVIQNAADTVMLTKMSVNQNPIVYVTCDKGNKKGNKHLAKYYVGMTKMRSA